MEKILERLYFEYGAKRKSFEAEENRISQKIS